MTRRVEFQEMIESLRHSLATVPEHRRGRNTQNAIADSGLAAFSKFYTQWPSFLTYRRHQNGCDCTRLS